MIEMSAREFMEIYNKLPNPNDPEIPRKYQYGFRIYFIPEAPLVKAHLAMNVLDKTIDMVEAKVIEFKLSTTYNGFYWEPVEPIVIKKYKNKYE